MPLNRPYESLARLPSVIPVFPLSGALLLPRGELPLNIFEPRYLAMIDEAMKIDRLIGMIQPSLSPAPSGSDASLESVGCLGRITQLSETGDGRYLLNLTGVIRFRVAEELNAITPYRQCRIAMGEFATDLAFDPAENSVDRSGVIDAFRQFSEARHLQVDWAGIEAAPTEALINALVMMAPFKPTEKQALLEAENIALRAQRLISIAAGPASKSRSVPSTLH